MHKRLILEYLKFWAKRKLQQNPKAIIIGITGSAGKTSTRLALVEILKTHGVVKHSVHANSESGIPLNILGLSMRSYSLFDWLRVVLWAPLRLLTHEHFDYYVVEMGIDSPNPPKNMSYLLSIIRPHVAVVLGASLTHTANFDSLVKDVDPQRRRTKLIDLIAKEKMQLAAAIPPQGTAIINIDSPPLTKYLKHIKSRLITYGDVSSALLKIAQVNLSRHGFSMTLGYQGQRYQLTHPDILGLDYASTFAAALSAGVSVGIPLSSGIKALQNFHAPAGRLRLFAGIHQTTILDSSYNASPLAMKNSLLLLNKLGGRAHKIAVLGDMRELGKSSKVAHRDLASQIIRSVDEAILFGKETLTHTLPILKNKRFPVHHFANMAELTAYLRSHLTPHSWILVKGSQNQILLERAVASILQNPADQAKLCRRGPYWDKIRQITP